MWRFNSCLFALWFVFSLSVAQAGLPKHELTYEFKGVNGNTGGFTIQGGRYRYENVEIEVAQASYGVMVALGARLDFNTDSFFVPHLFGGVELSPTPSLMPGVGAELLLPSFQAFGTGLRFGVRINQYVLVMLNLRGEVMSFVTVGVTCHF